MPDLPQRPSLEHLRKQAKALKRQLEGIERALVLADPAALSELLAADRAAATARVDELPALLALMRRSTGSRTDVRDCARLLLDAGADPNSHTVEWGGQGRMSALFDAVERGDVDLVRLLLERGAAPDDDAFYHACEQSDTTFLDLLYEPGFEKVVNHKLDFEDAAGLQWFLDRAVDVDARRCLHHAIARGRGVRVITMLLDAGADPNLPWDRWDVGRRPLALAARCGHLAAYELLAARGATAELDPVDAAVLAVARGESVRLPKAPPPSLGNPRTDDFGWILGQFALLGRTEVVRSLLDGADLTDCAFDDEGPTPLDCALWGLQNNRADDGDYHGTVEALIAAGAPTRVLPPTGEQAIDKLLTRAIRG